LLFPFAFAKAKENQGVAAQKIKVKAKVAIGPFYLCFSSAFPLLLPFICNSLHQRKSNKQR
jgi:hypothetical protein